MMSDMMIGIYLTGAGLSLLWTFGAMLWFVVKHNDVPEWETIAKEWGLSVFWPLTLLMLITVWSLELIRHTLHGKQDA